MTPEHRRAALTTVLCALSLSLGWGIRGNFGHEYGALVPGALAALAAVLATGRPDWWRRAPYFAALGALGWSFGGSMSYMQVIAYTHSGHLPSQAYGFDSLAVLGFLWGALGGAGTALPACLDRARLAGLFPPLLAVFAAWALQDVAVPWVVQVESGARRHESPLYWYDTDWLAALVALAAVVLFALARRRLDWGSRLVLSLAAGWWAGFLAVVALVDGLGVEFRMTPPRGDNWAGVAGMTAAALVFFWRHGLMAVVYAMLVSGFWGGFGFAAATLLKLVEVKYVPLALSQLFGAGAWQTNWHSVLEQTYGLINGVGIAAAMTALARRLPPAPDEPRDRRWTEAAAVAFVLLAVPYVNLVKNVPHWVRLGAIPAALYGLPSRVWFDAGFGLLVAAGLFLLARHRKHRLAVVPESPLGQAQLLYLTFLWVMAVGNLMRALPPFADQRLITEGVIHVGAVACSVLALCGPQPAGQPAGDERAISGRTLLTVTALGLAALLATVALAAGVTRAVHGGAYVPHAGYHVRFGPDAQTGKPRPGQAHP
jgi:hypothetical protein